MKKKDALVLALAKEITLRKKEFENECIETIYFGGGTPSVLTMEEINFLIQHVYQNFEVSENPEITLEANPDDLSETYLVALSESPVNRLSIGVQSFFEADLQMMNRAHNSEEAIKCLEIATRYFGNISIDLIYGIPGMTNERWSQNIQKALDFGISHISSYALTVEPKTALNTLIKNGKIAPPQDDVAQEHFMILVDTLEANGFIHYELSNFGKEHCFSRNNSAYWLGKKYLGIGPSAHSYDGVSRSWNVANNTIYINKIESNVLPNEMETLTLTDRYNEYIMTGLRTIWGVSLQRISDDFGSHYRDYLNQQMQSFLIEGLLVVEDEVLRPTKKGKFLTDGIASDLFYLNLE
jgi:oxygen-independent coproporphyrinogen-3 oxidase